MVSIEVDGVPPSNPHSAVVVRLKGCATRDLAKPKAFLDRCPVGCVRRPAEPDEGVVGPRRATSASELTAAALGKALFHIVGLAEVEL